MATHQTVTDTTSWAMRIPESIYRRLQAHHFPGDHDEHGSIILAGIAQHGHHLVLLARNLYLAEDGKDFVAGTRGYRMLRGEFITKHILEARDEQLVYIAIHNHGGATSVAFSDDDQSSQHRGYPALMEITGQPVAALVLAKSAIAGNLWIGPERTVAMDNATVVGTSIKRLTAEPVTFSNTSLMYDRQARLFGDHGQALLHQTCVGIIGAGGVGSLLVQYLSRLGVGHIIIIDPDRIDITNLPRLPEATPFDARTFFTRPGRPPWLQRLGRRLALTKVGLARRVARRANPEIRFEGIVGDVTNDAVARRLLSCDYLFLAADTMQARLVFNAIVNQYLIPGYQIGSKVVSDKETGQVHDVYSVVRPVLPGQGCLQCNSLIDATKLQDEALSKEERQRQRYIDDDAVLAPSVITLNAVGAAHAANDFLFAITGLADGSSADYQRFVARDRNVISEEVQQQPDCRECTSSNGSRLGRGDTRRLPTRISQKKK